MFDVVGLILGTLVGIIGISVLGYLYIKEKTRHHNALIRMEILEYDAKAASEKLATLDKAWTETVKSAEVLAEDYRKLLNQKKSSEVRVGKIGENLAPFLDGWPYDPNSFRFLGNPIDGIQFADDKIRFVEIKTGKARLSAGQKQVRDLVRQGKVSFVSFRIDEEGCSLIEEDLIT